MIKYIWFTKTLDKSTSSWTKKQVEQKLKICWICKIEIVKVAQSCPTLCDPMDHRVHGILRLEYWSGQHFPSPGDLHMPGIKPPSPALQADSLPAEPEEKPPVPEGHWK